MRGLGSFLNCVPPSQFPQASFPKSLYSTLFPLVSSLHYVLSTCSLHPVPLQSIRSTLFSQSCSTPINFLHSVLHTRFFPLCTLQSVLSSLFSHLFSPSCSPPVSSFHCVLSTLFPSSQFPLLCSLHLFSQRKLTGWNRVERKGGGRKRTE